MSALDTAQRVLDWAAGGPAGASAPPRGDLLRLEELSRPPAAVRLAVSSLAAAASARFRLGAPPLGDARPPGLGALLLAAAIGGGGGGAETQAIVGTVPDPGSAADLAARHAVVAPALRHLPPEVARECRLSSPLTGVLSFPAPDTEAEAFARAEAWRNVSGARSALVLHLAQPAADPQVARWRADMLDRWRVQSEEGRVMVLDVYEAALVHHEPELQEAIREAQRVLRDPTAGRDPARLQAALGTAGWWGPLFRLERSHLDLVRRRAALGYGYRAGLALFRLAQRLTGGLAR